MPAEIAVVLDVARYRLRRLEMANLAASAVIMVALRLQPADMAVRLVFGLLLNLLVYLNNDYLDRRADLLNDSRDRVKTAYLDTHARAALRAQVGLLVLLGLFAWGYGHGLGLALVLGAGVCGAYSAWLKRRPGVDVLAMIVWGAAMPLVAVPPESTAGWALVGQLALFSGVFETIQVMRDHDDDARQGVRTTAVVLGLEPCRWLLRALLALAALYAAVTFGLGPAVLVALALLLPIPRDGMQGYWNRIRAVLGLSFALECALVWASEGLR